MILETYKQGKATSRLERAGICSGIQSTWANTWYLPEVPGGESYRNLQSYAIQLGTRATDMWYWYLQGTHRIVRPGEMGNTNKPSAVTLMTLKWKLSFTCALKECKVLLYWKNIWWAYQMLPKAIMRSSLCAPCVFILYSCICTHLERTLLCDHITKRRSTSSQKCWNN